MFNSLTNDLKMKNDIGLNITVNYEIHIYKGQNL